MKIRTVKPEFWQSEKLATRISREARLLFIGLFNAADDHGRFRAHPNLVRGELFPYEPDAPVEAWIRELVAIGVVRLYQVGGQSYGVVVNFAEHQKIDRRWASRLPAPPGEPGEADGHDDDQAPPDEPAPVTTGPAVHQASPAGDTASTNPAMSSASLAKETASLPEQAGNLANTTPTDRKGREGKGTPSDARARAKGQRSPDPEPERRPDKKAEDSETPISNLIGALFKTTLRADANAIRRRGALRPIAIRIAPTGITPDKVAEVFAVAQEVAARTGRDGGGLLDEWFVQQPPGYWQDVLGEHAMKAEVAGGAADRARARRDQADGVEGAEPKMAASVVGAAVAGLVREGARA